MYDCVQVFTNTYISVLQISSFQKRLLQYDLTHTNCYHTGVSL